MSITAGVTGSSPPLCGKLVRLNCCGTQAERFAAYSLSFSFFLQFSRVFAVDVHNVGLRSSVAALKGFL